VFGEPGGLGGTGEPPGEGGAEIGELPVEDHELAVDDRVGDGVQARGELGKLRRDVVPAFGMDLQAAALQRRDCSIC
jgi:hypothetical protein